jgi:hypothetical protein
MKKILVVSIVAIMAICCGCLSRQAVKTGDSNNAKKSKITFSGGSGDSYETAIIIKGTQYNKKTEDAVAAEYDYISGMYGKKDKDWIVEEQSMVQEKGKVYDMVRSKILSNGKMHFFYFDISFFSKKTQPPAPKPEE